MERIWQRLLKSTWVHVAFGFCAMGSWGLFANAAHPMAKMLFAGCVQGIMSAILTLFLKRSVDWMRPQFPRGVGYWMPPLIASLVSAAFLVVGHLIFGTPEVLKTITAPIAVSVTYIFTYNVLRQKNAGKTIHD